MKPVFFLIVITSSITAFGQKQGKTNSAADTANLNYNDIFSELDQLLADISKTKSFALLNVSVGNAYLTFQRQATDSARAMNKVMISPSLAYFHKSGFGIAAETDIVNDGKGLNPYQLSLTGSYDYLKNRHFITGVSFSHYFEKKNLSFYTSPLQNDAFAYFTYRKSGLKPSVNMHYGWGSQEAVTIRKEKIKNLRTTRSITTVKQVADFNLTTSLRYTFTWTNTFSQKDYLRFTPQLSFISGTQQFGFNQTNNIAIAKNNSGKHTIYSTENLVLNDKMKFKPLSLTTFLKTEYAKGKFFVQPQVIFDYYFPSLQDNFTVSFLVNTGITFY